MPPILVYTAKTPALAEILKDVLRRDGIEAMTLPFVDEQPNHLREVWIADDQELARACQVVQRYENETIVPCGSTWRCPKCGEVMEPQFTECWRCGASRG